MEQISSSQRHSRHLAVGGQLDFSHLLTEPKDSSTITTFDCTGKESMMDGLSDMKIVLKLLEFYCRTFKIIKIQCSTTADHKNN
jgi:hypothetical protein